MYRRYYSYNDMPTLPNINQRKKESDDNCNTEIENECHQSKPTESPPCPTPIIHKDHDCQEKDKGLLGGIVTNGKIFGKFEVDDVLLLVVIFILLVDDCDDKLLVLALGFIFLTGIL